MDSERESLIRFWKGNLRSAQRGAAITVTEAGIEALLAALSSEPAALWTCPECAFSFSAEHENDTPEGGYSCPVCELANLRW